MGKMKNIKNPVFALDFEGSRKIGIVEYGVAEIVGGEIAACSTRICSPRAKIPAADAEFFGITNEAASGQAPFEADLGLFCDMRRRGVFASHNAAAEDTMLRGALPLPPATVSPLTGAECVSWGPYIDTCALAKKIFRPKSCKLADLIGAFGLGEELEKLAQKHCPGGRRKWHCALFDAIACALVLIKICSFDGFEEVSLEWLLKHSSPLASAQQRLL